MENRLFYARHLEDLPETGWRRVAPEPVSAPAMLLFNRELAADFDLPRDWQSGPLAADRWSGNALPDTIEPTALAYAGHQFGQPVPQLGDGRALLLGQLRHRDGRLRDVQLKGSGRTPFSRMGDGRAGIGPVLREFLVSEAMAALGIPTTRALAALATGDTIQRQFGPEPGAILVRVASSHLRFGSFEYFAHRGDREGLQRLADAAVAWHYPDLLSHDPRERCLALLERVMEQTASLVSEWMRVGFIHGVMNTDNMTLSGETLDYGPCAFMDEFRAGQVLSSVDRGGRYAFDQQPYMAQWNLTRLAECLLPLLDEDTDTAVDRAEGLLTRFPDCFRQFHHPMLAAKIGLPPTPRVEEDAALTERLLGLMEQAGADFTNTFRELGRAAPTEAAGQQRLVAILGDRPDTRTWLKAYARRCEGDDGGPGVAESDRRARMAETNPVHIPRNHLVEAALVAAEGGDLRPAEDLLKVVRSPYTANGLPAIYRQPPEPEERVHATFCGT